MRRRARGGRAHIQVLVPVNPHVVFFNYAVSLLNGFLSGLLNFLYIIVSVSNIVFGFASIFFDVASIVFSLKRAALRRGLERWSRFVLVEVRVVRHVSANSECR